MTLDSEMELGLSMVNVISFDFSSLKRELKSISVLDYFVAISEDIKESLKLKRYIPSTCINNCIGISKFIKNCLFECCSNSMQIPLTQLYLAVGCSDYTLLYILFGKMNNQLNNKSKSIRTRHCEMSFSRA